MEQFYTLLTDVGKAKIANATALQTKVKFTKILVGDSNGSYYEPTETQTKLKNKVWEGGIGNISIDKDNPNWIILESVIPSSVGGFTIREVGIEDSEGDLVVIAKYPQTYKPKIADGSTKDLIIKTILEVTNVDTITLKVDPTIVLTTKKDLIDSQKNLEEKLNKKYMQTSIYDKNNNGIVDDSEKLGGKPPKDFLQKNAGTTWDDINKYKEEVPTSKTPILKLIKPGTNSKAHIIPITKNFDILEDTLVRLGISELKDGGTNIDNLNTPGVYLLQNMENPPDIPPAGQRNYIVRVYAATSKYDLYYHVESLGTGKQYMYRFNGGYSEIPCTSPKQPTDLYIDTQKGSDDNDGSTESKAVETWVCAYSRIPKILNKPLTIRFVSVPSNTNIVFSNITYEGGDDDSTKLVIHGRNHVVKKLSILNCNLSGYQYGINVAELSASEIILEGSSCSHMYKCQTDVIMAQDCYTYCEECVNKQYKAIRNAYMNVINHVTPPFSLGTYGCFADWGGHIYVQGNKPTGTSGDKYEAHGGKVEIIE